MAQRLYTKAFLVGRLQLDDGFLVLAWFTSIATVALCTLKSCRMFTKHLIQCADLVFATDMFAVGAGGVHGWEIPLEKFHVFMLDVFLAAPVYTLCGSFAKISLLIFYMRLSPQVWLKWAVWITLAVITGYSTCIFFALIFACSPIAMNWDVTVTEGVFINQPALYIATAVANIISDVMLFALPLPIVVKTVITSVIRASLPPLLLTSKDQTWAISYASLWIIVEANLLVICAALPTLRKFSRHVAPKIIGESTYEKKSKKTGESSKHMCHVAIGGTNGIRNRNECAEIDRNTSIESFAIGCIEPDSSKAAVLSIIISENETT
ncbi:hypothetical protein CCHL11_10090 [Colletotrichum chlorophyti]|uniref:Rhodopsin domain-containing protein n=1 Tax=Colletotrichum chlorophyti TaxID=708187 RepID=A0A1Q8RNT4_9PEZI|nr:hypothetical protein CCHL11_10090 [Colletotrichum chlorophyti]